jgi:gliding motility-associated-like protein
MTKFLHLLSLLLCSALVGSTAAFAQAPINDECLSAIDLNALATGGAYYNYCSLPNEFTSLNATTSVFAPPAPALPVAQPTCFLGANSRDVWFTFTTNSANLNLTLSILGGAGAGQLKQPQFALYRAGTFGCPIEAGDEDLLCKRAAAGGNNVVGDLLALDAATTYYIRVNDYSATATPNAGTFQLCLKPYVPRTILNGTTAGTTVTACSGVLVDSGNYGNYDPTETGTITIAPTGAGCLSFTLDTLNIPTGATFTVTYDSSGISKTRTFTNSNNPRQITSTNGSVTVTFTAPLLGAGGPGFVAHWSCAADCATLQPCSATIYDPSGPGIGVYGPNLNVTTTYCPNAPGRRMQINFHAINVTDSDNFTVYDGTSANPLLSFGAVNDGLFSGPGADYTAIASIGNTSGCLTVVFTSNGAGGGTGYFANLQCNKPCQTIVPVLTLASAIPTYPSPSVSTTVPDSAINICLGQTVTISGSATYPQNNTLYAQNDLSALYIYNWGDGGICGTGAAISGPPPHTASHVYTTPGIYRVRLTVADSDSLCGVQAPQFMRVRVMGKPQYQITAPAPICLGQSVSLSSAASGSVSVLLPPPSINSIPPSSVSGTLCVPDYPGGVLTPFVSPVLVQNLNTLTLSPTFHIKAVYAKFQHTYMGDLDIKLRCPNNSNIILKQYVPGAPNAGSFYGIANDNLSTCNEEAQGLIYGWNGLNTTTVTPLLFPNCTGGSTQPDYSYCSNCSTQTAGGQPTVPITTPPTLPNYITYPMQYFGVSMNAATLGNGISAPAAFTNPYVTPFPPSGYVTPGFFNSFDPMANLNGCPVNGTWSLEFTDHLGSDNGIIYEWGIVFDDAAYPNLETYLPTVQSGFTCNPTITTPSVCTPPIYAQSTVVATPTTVGTVPYPYRAIISGFPACAYFDTIVNVTVKPLPILDPMRDTSNCQPIPSLVLPIGAPTVVTCTSPSPVVVTGGPAVTINASGNASPFPANLNAALTGNCNYKVQSVTVNGITHTWPSDIDMWIQSPTGQAVILMSDVGSSIDFVPNTNLTFQMGSPLMTGTTPGTGTYAPTDITPGDVGIPAGATTNLATLTGTAAQMSGNWGLYIIDDVGGDAGAIVNWSITFATTVFVPPFTHQWVVTGTNTPVLATTPTYTVACNGTANYTHTLTSTVTGCSTSRPVAVTCGSLPAPVVGCVSTSNSVTYTWPAVVANPVVTAYEISTDNGVSWTNIGNLTNYTASGLSQNSPLTTQIRAIGGCVSAIATSTCTTLVACATSGTVTPTTCGLNNGAITIIGSGGTPPYTATAWTTTSSTPASGITPTSLAAGIYTVTVADANSCTSTASFTIAASVGIPAPTISCGTITQNSVQFNWAALAGATSYEYSLDGGLTWIPTAALTYTQSGMTLGQTQNIKVRGVGTCPATIGTWSCTTNVCSTTGTPTATTCGLNNGSIAVVATGTGTITYAWLPATASGANPTGLAAGTYTVTTTDANACTSTASFVVAASTALLAPVVSCGTPTQTSVTFNWTAVAGVTSYEYSLNGGLTWTQTAGLSFTNTGMAPNATATIQVRGFGSTCTAPIGTQTCTAVNCAMTAMLTPTATSCNQSNGALAAMPMGVSTAPVTYAWSPILPAIANPTGLFAGTYTVTLTDALGCTATASAAVAASSGITASFANTTQTTCGLNNGSTTATVIGGTANTYAWSNGTTTTALLSPAMNGTTYTVTITSTLGCTATNAIVFNTNQAVTLSIVKTDVICNGANDGTATAIVLTGNGGNTFAWSNMTTANPATALAPNTYTVTVTDSQSCSNTRSVTITQPTALVITPTPTAAICNGAANGSVSTNVTGGGAPYLFQWASGVNATPTTNPNTVTGLAAGTYTVTVTDFYTCVRTATVVVGQPAAVTATATTTLALCNGASTGTLTATGGNGSGAPYTYALTATPANTTGNATGAFTGLAAGTYTVTVSDAASCTTTISASVGEPSPISASITTTAVLCNGGTTGTATVTASGATPGYTYAWDLMPNTGATAIGLNAGTHTVTVTDANTCTASFTVNVAQPAVLSVGISNIINPTCANSGANGRATAAGAGGVSSVYTYLWSSGSTAATPINFMANTYTVTVKDANNCTATASVTFTAPVLPIATITPVQPTCGLNNGSLTASVTNAPAGATYTYAWNGGIPTNPRTNVGAGFYVVTVTDGATACKATASMSLLPSTAPMATIVPTNPTCGNASSLCASLTASTAATYAWSTLETTVCISPTTAGPHTVTVTDVNGCTVTRSASIVPLVVFDATIAATNITCNGLANGTVTLTMTNTTASHTMNYAWSSTLTGVGPFTGVAAGTYTVTITDVTTQCIKVLTTTVLEPTVLGTWTGQKDVTCFNGTTGGEVSATPYGGSPTYSYAWTRNGVTVGGNTATINPALIGAYAVTVTDANGCSVIATTWVGQSGPLAAYASQQDVTCFNGTTGGQVSVVSGGLTPLSYTWTRDGAIVGGNTATINPALTGAYAVTITDVNGCTATSTTWVGQPGPLAAYASQRDVTCFNGTTGGQVSVVSGGLTPLSYTWTRDGATVGGNTATINPALTGAYAVTVTDVNGCTATSTTWVGQPGPLAAYASQRDVTCFNGTTGGQVSVVSGGLTPLSYTWTRDGATVGGNTATINPALTGAYAVTVTDVNGCTATSTTWVGQPGPLAAYASQRDVICFNGTTGGQVSVVSGGLTPLSYTWTRDGATVGGNTATINPALTGAYAVTVTDVNGCTATSTTWVGQPGPMAAYASQKDVNCFNSTTGGQVSVQSGGTAPFTYNWENGGVVVPNTTTLATILNALTGAYAVTVTDINGCTATATTWVGQPGPLVAYAAQKDVNCFNGTIGGQVSVISSGTAPFTYNWENGGVVVPNTTTLATIPNALTGTYAVTITDANGCKVSTTTYVGQPGPLVAYAAQKDVNCFNGTIGGQVSVISSGTAPFTYNWENGGVVVPNTTTLATIPNALTGTYAVTITDANGCKVSTTTYVGQPGPLSAYTSQKDVTCFNGTTGGEVSVQATGVGTLSYAWTRDNSPVAGNTATLTNALTGTYNVIVTDANGCKATATTWVGQPGPLSVAITAAPQEITIGGEAHLHATDVPGASYIWTGSTGTTDHIMVKPTIGTTYTVVVTSTAGCTATASITVAVRQIAFQMPNFFTPNGDGQNDDFYPVSADPTLQITEFTIYNRWGQVVHSAATPWDGNFQGSAQVMDTYVYVLKYILNGETKALNGDFMLIR